MKLKMALLYSITIAAMTTGCATLNQRTNSVLNPEKLHDQQASAGPTLDAAQVPIDDYYHALALAKTAYKFDSVGAPTGYTKQSSDLIENYVNEGIGLVDAYCNRWFQRLDDLQRKLQYEENNLNIITQLGTALLGIGHANSYIVGGYGAINTAATGMLNNYSDTFLAAPTTAKVRQHIVSAMDQAAGDLRGKSKSLDFKQAYSGLERYAAICTYSQAKEIVDDSLSETKTEFKNGAVSTTK